jgi:hypothetical protein
LEAVGPAMEDVEVRDALAETGTEVEDLEELVEVGG